ncbi:MAG: SRPBCC domain-containing protein [Candidatus Lokiarchaeota archaeon]|nr:SRPBCC domain-containing protein [Candidatus Lokiarchaeota archaeon]
MREIVSEIEINAKPSKVWEVLVDFSSYPEWNPFMRKIEGELNVGSKLEVTIDVPNRDPMTFKPVVLKANPNEEFRWKTKMFAGFLFTGEHYFILEPIGEETTKFIQGEKFTGILVSFLVKSSNEDTPLGFVEFNRAIKEQCEK